jgi:hypothetical protein
MLVNMATSAGMRVGLVIRPQTAVKVRAATLHSLPLERKKKQA